ncbi:MAG: MATE family efflux transporter [Clostridia bacterium]|nr:MATE family efflux transporter [Clostridia bacterium]
MTSGPLLHKVILFSAPLVLTGVLQLLYNAADMVVVGNFAGHEALAAVGSTGSLINLLVNVFMGLSVGASVQVARQWGARDLTGVSRGVHTAITVAGISGLLVGVTGFVLARPLLELMGNPADVIDLAALYMRIYFLGMPANMLYNFGAAILRAVGDTRRPLIYLTVAGLVNVVLNLLLVIVFSMSVAGVALATVISQVVSAALVLGCLCRSDGALHLDLHRLRIDPQQLGAIARVGLPAGLQGSLFSVSNVLIQSAINEFGSIAVAGNSVASSLEGFVYTSMNSIYQADLTFASQNYGAHKPDRVRRVMWVCLGTVAVVGLVLGFAFWALGTPLISIYNRDPEVIRFGLLRLSVIMPTYCLCGMMDTMVGQLRGIGCSITPMFVSLAGACLFRIVWIMTLFAQPAWHTLTVLYLSYPVSWALTFAVHLICWFTVSPRLLKTLEE